MSEPLDPAFAVAKPETPTPCPLNGADGSASVAIVELQYVAEDVEHKECSETSECHHLHRVPVECSAPASASVTPQAPELASRTTPHDLCRQNDTAGLREMGETDALRLCVERNERGWTPMHTAAAFERAECVRIIHAASVRLELKDPPRDALDCAGQTPLHLACACGANRCVEALLALGADASARDRGDATPLHHAAINRNIGAIERLLRTPDIRVNSADADGITPLMAAVMGESAEVAAMLLAAGADVSARNNSGMTAARLAAYWGLETCLAVLLDARASPLSPDENGATCAHAASEAGSVVCLEALASHCGRDDRPHCPSLTKLVGARDSRSAIPLHYAAYSGRLAAVEWHVRQGADVAARAADGATPLHAAASENHADCIEALLRASPALARARNGEGQLAIHAAAATGSIESFRVLFAAMPETVWTPDAGGQTPGDWAAQTGNTGVLRALLELTSEPVPSRTKTAWVASIARRTHERAHTHDAEHCGCAVVRRDDDLIATTCDALGIAGDVLAVPRYVAAVAFEGEDGRGSGVVREWISLAVAALCDTIMTTVGATDASLSQAPHLDALGGRRLMPAAAEARAGAEVRTRDFRACFVALGALLGHALVHGAAVPVRFAAPLLRRLCVAPADEWEDARRIDPELHRHKLQYMRDNDVTGIDATFTITAHSGDEVELVPAGAAIKVTERNKGDYIRLACRWLCGQSVCEEMDAIARGFHAIVAQDAAALLSPVELDLAVSGEQRIDVEAWRSTTRYAGGYDACSEPVRWFWAFVEEQAGHSFADDALRGTDFLRALLLFATGSESIPVGGFATQNDAAHRAFCITRPIDSPSARTENASVQAPLPTAAVCFGILRLPPYPTEETLRERLTTALRHAVVGFGED